MPESHQIPTIYEGLQFLQLVKHHIKNDNSKSQEVNVYMATCVGGDEQGIIYT